MTWCIFFFTTSVFIFTEYRNTGPSLVRWERKRLPWRTCCATKVFFKKYQINNWTIGQLDDWTIGQLSWRWSSHYWGQAGYSRQVSVWPISVFFLNSFWDKSQKFSGESEEQPRWPSLSRRETSLAGRLQERIPCNDKRFPSSITYQLKKPPWFD